MSWPSDGLPRFKATAIHGDGAVPRMAAKGYPLDRAFCHKAAVTVTGRNFAWAFAKAQEIADELNGGVAVAHADVEKAR